MRGFLFLLFLLPVVVFSQNQITLDVHDVPSSKGKISVAVYNTKEGFLKFDKVYKCDSIVAQKGITHIAIEDLPEGEYALAIFHDENGNNKLDTNWLGIPKEKVAFSNAKMRTFGPPAFKDCAFKLDKDTKINVSL
ncbi:hypothetical protein MTsPCn9_12990 [Croceitalea sp. MTPC9]|uniref:DUF2141 domain-containing protein n=1 Tax=unclassified Croceitalea TaxID=2632280 RepID=UPI002B37DF35|nr:hypothetical protein MTsPCn6_16140 [Croceitalea sp. MTPC6]GMN16363.1 hypothetical protein MTsPCn9_12990 [Croceitalea sp. MTPC9]